MAKEGEYRAPKSSTHPVHSSTFLAFEVSDCQQKGLYLLPLTCLKQRGEPGAGEAAEHGYGEGWVKI